MHFHETETISLYLDDLKLIYKTKSDYHNILLCKHPKLGKILIIDNEIMHAENYEFFYHEPLVHLPFAINHSIKDVLIIGGGSLFAAKEVLKYKSVKNLILCDHDQKVLNIMKHYYSHAEGVLFDKRFNYIEKDALDYLNETDSKFDLIINDCFDLSKIFVNSVNLYDILDCHLKDNGLCSDMIYNDIFDRKNISDSLFYLRKKQSLFYSMMCIPEYPGVLHLHTIWSKNKINVDFNNISNEQLLLYENHQFQLFNPHYIHYYFYLPKFLKDLIT